MNYQLKLGDIFCTKNPMWLGRAINMVQTFNASDNQSEYSHSGIIVSAAGGTFESLWTIKQSNMDAYKGKKVLIGRHQSMTPEMFKTGWKAIEKHEGQVYPGWRLFFHLLPPLAKYISTGGFPVCSELACKFLYSVGLVEYWKGKNPDHVADMIHRWKQWYIVYEDVWL